MEASNGSAFLPLFVILGWLGLTISWFPVRVGETELPMQIGPWGLNLEFSSELMFRDVALSLIVRLIFLEVPRKMCAQLRTASVTLSLRSTVWCGLKMSCTPITLTVMGAIIGQMTTGMIFGKNRPNDNFCANFPLVV